MQPSPARKSQGTEFAEKIISELREYQAPELVRQVVAFIGPERAEGFFQQTLQIESKGGMMTLRGERRRTPGGVFLTLVRNNTSDMERELLFPSGKENLPDAYIVEALQEFSETQLEIGAERIEQTISRSVFLDGPRKTQLLKIKQLTLERIEGLRTQAANSGLAELKEAAKSVADPQAQLALLERVEEFEKLVRDRKIIREDIIGVELERQRSQIQLEAEERRTKTRAQYWGQFLARESVATIIGSILLVIITIALLIAMFTGRVESRIIENGFLVLLGYFFGQTVSRTGRAKQRAESEGG